MLEIQLLRDRPDFVIERLQHKHFTRAAEVVGRLLELDTDRRAAIGKLEDARASMNTSAKAIGVAMAQKNTDEAERHKAQTADLKQAIATGEDQVRSIEAAMHELLVLLPNLPHHDIPAGRLAEDNKVVQEHGAIPTLHEGALPHWELARKHNLIDWELGVKLTGAGFPVYLGKGARLQRALINFFLDHATAAGYLEVEPPILVNADSGFGTGQLPDKEGQMYYVTEDQLYLIPTAEVPITNLYRDVIVDEKDLPIRNCGYTPCFRREAGSYGKDVRGLNRLHQFDKVEIVQITRPEDSYAALEGMLRHSQSLLEALELPYRTLLLCGGDMTFSSSKTYDLEVYSAAQSRWLEVSSVSNFESFQANRLKLRYRPEGQKKTALAHTLNGSALALPRIVAALLENNQDANGVIHLPKVLHPYTGFATIG